MEQAHYIAIAIGAVVGILVTYLVVRMARRKEPALAQPFETNGEADLTPRQMAVPSHEQLAAASKALNGKESFADVKDTF